MARRWKRSKIQYMRWACLSLVVAFFVFVPLSNRYANFKSSYNQARLVELSDGPVVGFLYRGLDAFYSWFEDPVDAATSNNGSLWAYEIMGIPLSDPLGALSNWINSVEFPAKYLIGALIPLLVALLLGRVFCAWLCPMALVYGVTGRLRKTLDRWRVPLLRVRLEPSTRAFVFWLGLAISYFFGGWVWHFVLPYISFTHEIFSFIVFSGFTVGIYFLVAVVVLDIGLIPGEFCRSVCPTGFMLSVIGRISLFQLKANKSNCIKGCTTCRKVCPYDLFPKEGEVYSCHLCMKCVDNCPRGHIEMGLNPIYKRPTKKASELASVFSTKEQSS